MPAQGIDPSERISNAFSKLADAAKSINEVSDELAKPVAALQIALKKLNIGVACWTKIQDGQDEWQRTYWRNDVGYAQLDGVWRIAIRSVTGTVDVPESEGGQEWPFNDAPRHLRIKAIDFLPALIEDMVKATEATTKRLKDKIPPAQALAYAVARALTEKSEKNG